MPGLPRKLPGEHYNATMLERGLQELAKGREVVYFVKSGEHVKIGRSSNLRLRLGTLRMSCPQGAQLIGIALGGETLERAMHEALREFHHRGEWFRLCPQVVKVIRWEGFWPGCTDKRTLIYPTPERELARKSPTPFKLPDFTAAKLADRVPYELIGQAPATA